MTPDTPTPDSPLTPRWTPLKYHEVQAALWLSKSRFNVVPAGRRSGKTELVGKRKIVYAALSCHIPSSRFYSKFADPRYFCAAPTRDQAKRIYWKDLKNMIPAEFVKEKLETNLSIHLINNAEIHVLGMDKPERVEGTPWDGGVLDEYANMKKDAWDEHVRPAMSDRYGWCDFIGVPEGRNHYYQLYKRAQAHAIKAHAAGKLPLWDTYHWLSADILPASEIQQAKAELDELVFQQEYCGSFLNFTGVAYYNYDENVHLQSLRYNPNGDLIFAFDFNVSPGVAAVGQEMVLPFNREGGTGWIGEVWIPRNSNTPRVCDKLLRDWGRHRGRVFCYGDSSGGAKGSAKIRGTDWEIIREKLRPAFGDRLFFKVPLANPREKDRVNAVNSRFKTASGIMRMAIDPYKCPNLVTDFESMVVVEGGSGELDDSDPMRGHITDAVGYYINREFPIKREYKEVTDREFWK
jgi:hypothetical protein